MNQARASFQYQASKSAVHHEYWTAHFVFLTTAILCLHGFHWNSLDF